MNQKNKSNHGPAGKMAPAFSKYLLLAVLVLGNFGGLSVRAADTAPEFSRLSVANVHSTCMSKDIEAAIMLPSSYAGSAGRRYPVIYFMDGHSGDGKRLFYDFYKDDLLKQSDKFNVIMVAVGGLNTWYFDCGTDDFFLAVNRALDQKLNDMKIAHTYEEFPGGHSQDYWGRSLPKQVQFFSKYLATGK